MLWNAGSASRRARIIEQPMFGRVVFQHSIRLVWKGSRHFPRAGEPQDQSPGRSEATSFQSTLGIGRASHFVVRTRKARSTRLPVHDFIDGFCELLKFRLCSGAGGVFAHRETAHHGFSHYDPLPDPRQYLLSQLFQ
jgi:hypothetical protein